MGQNFRRPGYVYGYNDCNIVHPVGKVPGMVIGPEPGMDPRWCLMESMFLVSPGTVPLWN